ncbi:MAG: PIN domain-containing protein [Chloroflexi bacterium]|nr:PIN domain-containing protein [Chloroflexota bacterium]
MPGVDCAHRRAGQRDRGPPATRRPVLSPVPYLDTSVVVAYYLPEPLSARAQEFYAAQTSPAVSELVELEFLAALSQRMRVGDLLRVQAEQVASLFLTHLDGGWYTRIHLHAGHFRSARDFVERFDVPLKSPDALHLAAAAAEGLQLVTADQQLARNAAILGLAVQLITL